MAVYLIEDTRLNTCLWWSQMNQDNSYLNTLGSFAFNNACCGGSCVHFGALCFDDDAKFEQPVQPQLW